MCNPAYEYTCNPPPLSREEEEEQEQEAAGLQGGGAGGRVEGEREEVWGVCHPLGRRGGVAVG
jgi:hypothetical protein